MDDETQLALAAAEGDPRALDELVRRTQADIWRFCAHFAGTPHAEDLTQETYARALRSLPNYRGEAGVRVWLLVIARRACADHVRGQVRRRALTDRVREEAHRVGPRVVDDATSMHRVSASVAALPTEFRAAFILTQVLGLSYASTASVCDCPVGTVRSRVARAREAIIRDLAAGDPLAQDAGTDS